MSRFLAAIIIVLLTVIISLNNITTVKCVPETEDDTRAECTMPNSILADPDLYASLVADLLSLLSANTGVFGDNEYHTSVSSRDDLDGATTAVYGLARCRDVEQDCTACLKSAERYLPEACPSAIGAWVQMTDCFMRYENFPFYYEEEEEGH